MNKLIDIQSIKVGSRYRKDMGDIEALSDSIKEMGLLQPIGVTPEHELVWGHRRLLAFMEMGFETIPARIIHMDNIVFGEYAENEVRKDFTISERVAIGAEIEKVIGDRKGSNQYQRVDEELVENFPQAEHGSKTRDIAAKKSGFGNGKTYQQAKSVVNQGTTELVEKMDSGDISVSLAAQLASLPEEEQQRILMMNKKSTMAAAKKLREQKESERRKQRLKQLSEMSNPAPELNTETQYPVILADPPWEYERPVSGSRNIENHYPVMTLDDIRALPVLKLATKDAILFMWATAPKLAESMMVMEAWGFKYRSCAVWDKQIIGMGYWFRQQTELLLVGIHGNMPSPAPSRRASSLISTRRLSHSCKPDEVYSIIENMYPGLPKVELFCRTPRPGWAVFGNQCSD